MACPKVTTSARRKQLAHSIYRWGIYDRAISAHDLPCAFLNTLTDELVLMVLKGELCELMCKVYPKLYCQYVTADRKGAPILYVQLYK